MSTAERRCKLHDRVEVVRSECGNDGRQGVIESEVLVLGVPKWQVFGNFSGHDGSWHSYGLFMDMDLRPLNTPFQTQTQEDEASV